jgi:hypothetical protein
MASARTDPPSKYVRSLFRNRSASFSAFHGSASSFYNVVEDDIEKSGKNLAKGTNEDE